MIFTRGQEIWLRQLLLADEELAAKDAAFFHIDGLRIDDTLQGATLGYGDATFAHNPRGGFPLNLDGLHLEGTNEFDIGPFFKDQMVSLDTAQKFALVSHPDFAGARKIAAQFALDDRGTTRDFRTGDIPFREDEHLALGLNAAP